MARPKILFIGGSLNQTTMMHSIAKNLQDEAECVFTPFYDDGVLGVLAQKGILDFTVLGGAFRKATLQYLRDNNLSIDMHGASGGYDLVYMCSDLIVPNNILPYKKILVQEGMTDPENLMFYAAKYLKFPRWLASTSTTGLSDVYDAFCVASEGYKQHFVRKGVKPEKVVVTGIPNFDNCAQFRDNSFPYKNFVLVATSDARETFKFEDRRAFIRSAMRIAGNKQLIFKLHPNENFPRARREILQECPSALVYTSGSIGEMIANCDTLITKYSSVVYVGIALGKEVFSYFDLDELHRLAPIQNGATSGIAIAEVGRAIIAGAKRPAWSEAESREPAVSVYPSLQQAI